MIRNDYNDQIFRTESEKNNAIIKKISNKKTISVMDDMLNSGFILFLPLNLIILQVHLISLKNPE